MTQREKYAKIFFNPVRKPCACCRATYGKSQRKRTVKHMDDGGPSCSRKPRIQHNVNKNHVVQAVLCCIINRKRQDRYGLWQTMPFCVLRRKTKNVF